MYILGITGGVGSGKSAVLNELRDNHGAYIIEADKLAHELMMPGKDIYNRIVDNFGEEILCDGIGSIIDRAKLADIVFSDENKLQILNNISHPCVKAEILRRIEEEKKKGTKLFVIEAALLIQDGYKEICDDIWYIWVSRELRTKRLMESRGYTLKKCNSIYVNQESDEYYRSNSDYVIDNEKDFSNTVKQINVLLNKKL